MTTPKFRIAIVGSGIGGVSLAVGLSRFPDIAFDIYEKHGNFEEIGAGVGIWGRSLKALDRMGVADELAKVATPPPPGVHGFVWNLRKSDTPEVGKHFTTIALAERGSSYHRAHFLSKLLTQMPDGHAHFNKRLQNFTQSSPTSEITLHFTDGTTATCDVLIGADGVKSPTRHGMVEAKAATMLDGEEKENLLRKAQPAFSGTVAYRGLMTAEQLRQENGGVEHPSVKMRFVYCGLNANLAVFPVAGGKLVNVAAFIHEPERRHKPWGSDQWVSDVSHEELAKIFDSWEPDVKALIRCIPKPSRWAIHEIYDIPIYSFGRVAILGDAAHATTPHNGQGACQSIEDAYALAEILGSPLTQKDTVELALKAYEKVRLPRGNHTVVASAAQGSCYQLNGPNGSDLDAISRDIEERYKWFLEGDIEEDVKTALAWLEEQVGSST